MPTDTSVKFFSSAMSGATAFSNVPGIFITILDACLVNGFGSVTLDSLVISDNVATGTKSTGHGFAMTGATGPVIRIEGATPSGLNGDWRIQSVPNSTTFTFTTSGISPQTATGTITAKRAPAGFEKVFSGTNKAVYRALDVRGTRPYFRLDDTAATGGDAWATVRMFETMTDVDTGTNGSTVYYFPRSNQANDPWQIYADWAGVWFVENAYLTGGWSTSPALFLGDLASPAIPNDPYRGMLIGCTTATNGAISSLVNNTDASSSRLMRSYDGATQNVGAYRRSHQLNSTYIGNGGAAYQTIIGLLVKAVEAYEGTTAYRGLIPGWYGQVHNNLSTWEGTYYEHAQIGTLIGRNIGGFYQFFDITGPWR